MKKVILLFLMFSGIAVSAAMAQCAMCRSTLENNYSNGDPGIAAGINTGILYLLSMPYLAVMVLGYLWYKSSKNAQKELRGSAPAR
jgi:branched-subunit amino acid transport protein